MSCIQEAHPAAQVTEGRFRTISRVSLDVVAERLGAVDAAVWLAVLCAHQVAFLRVLSGGGAIIKILHEDHEFAVRRAGQGSKQIGLRRVAEGRKRGGGANLAGQEITR